MPITQKKGGQIKDGTIQRSDLDVSTSTKAVITKVIAGTNITLSSTGPDAGTGDVTINAASTAPADITALSNATANSSYPSGAYAFNALITDGYPVDGSLTGKRNGTNNAQRLQDWITGATYAREWLNGSTAWSSWSVYLDAGDFTAKGQTHFSSASNAAGVLAAGTNGYNLVADSTQTLGVKWAPDVRTINFVIDGGGVAITTGLKGDIVFDFACTINQWTLLADQSGSIVVDIWKDTYANYPPVVGDSITASAKPTISSATKGQSSTLTGWTTSIAAGDIVRFNVDSITTCQRVTLAIKVTLT